MNLASSDPAVEAIANDVIQAACLQSGAEYCDELVETLNTVGGHELRDDARLIIADRLGDVTSPTGAGFLAVWLGAGVEGGKDPKLTGEAILNAFLHWSGLVESLPEDDEEADGEEESEFIEPEVDPDLVTGLETLGQGLVAHLSRLPELLAKIVASPDTVAELERVEYASAGPMWVLELLRKRSGTLVVIHVQQRRGVRVTYENLSNCFHLFTLLQAALADAKMPDAKQTSPQTLAVARGETMHECHDESWWHYGVGTCPTADLAGSIWGEADLSSIPIVDGQQVVLLWPMIMGSRQWGSGFFGPFLQAMPPAVSVQSELTEAEIRQWCTKLELPKLDSAAPQSTQWWKFW